METARYYTNDQGAKVVCPKHSEAGLYRNDQTDDFDYYGELPPEPNAGNHTPQGIQVRKDWIAAYTARPYGCVNNRELRCLECNEVIATLAPGADWDGTPRDLLHWFHENVAKLNESLAASNQSPLTINMEGYCVSTSKWVEGEGHKWVEKNYLWWEDNIAKPLLERFGYTNVSFGNGESDSFGPLSRVVHCKDAVDMPVKFFYG
jgi:hypothetical protein